MLSKLPSFLLNNARNRTMLLVLPCTDSPVWRMPNPWSGPTSGSHAHLASALSRDFISILFFNHRIWKTSGAVVACLSFWGLSALHAMQDSRVSGMPQQPAWWDSYIDGLCIYYSEKLEYGKN